MTAGLLGAAALGFLLGSIPWGLILLRLAGGPDPRTVGSGNIGATNVVRAGGKALGAATLLLDAAKGSGAAWAFGATSLPGAVAGGAAILGHCFTPWLRFRGGKGVATFIGCLGAVAWPALIAAAAVWLALAVVTRYSSLAALVASAATPPVLWWLGEESVMLREDGSPWLMGFAWSDEGTRWGFAKRDGESD